MRKMASLYQRKSTWWIKFTHPAQSKQIRLSLETSDPARAELLKEKIELAVALQQPRFRAVEIPKGIQAQLEPHSDVPRFETYEPAALQVRGNQPSLRVQPLNTIQVPQLQKVVTIEEAVAAYFSHVKSENAPMHYQNKVSHFRRFLGRKRMDDILGPTPNGRPECSRGVTKGYFKGEFLHEITSTVLQAFFDSMKVGDKTKRHFRQCFHHFFEVCMRRELYQPTNFFRPNPVDALPSYHSKNSHIVFLNDQEIEDQLGLLANEPALRIAVAVMIHAGLRRSEAIWLTRDAIAKDLSYLSVRAQIDKATGQKNSLKTGGRSVTILPPLKAALEEYLPTLNSDWLIPNPAGGRWHVDGFTGKLTKINRAAGLPWTCLAYRHTYATHRANEGWTLHRIAHEMGNSPQIVHQYYAAYIRPS